MPEIAEKGCDLRKECGFYCTVLRSKSEAWLTMAAKYCDGADYPLCARRTYFFQTGFCAPLDMTPLGVLSEDILAKLLK